MLADAFDRRWLMFGVQVYFLVTAVLLAVLTAAGMMPPALLLAFTFAIGAGMALLSPTWQAMITELVPRNELAAATRLDMVSVNVARAAGPALAGVVIARWGVPPVFALTAAAAGVLAVILLALRRPRVTTGERDPFLPALIAGGRYVRHEPVVQRLRRLRIRLPRRDGEPAPFPAPQRSIPLGAVPGGGESPEVFVEQFQVPTWQKHLRQHQGRLTAEDQAIDNAAFAHVLGAPRSRTTSRLALCVVPWRRAGLTSTATDRVRGMKLPPTDAGRSRSSTASRPVLG